VFASSSSLALLIASLLACAALLILQRRGGVGDRARIAALAVLAPVAFVAHLGVLRDDPEEGLSVREPLPHFHEIFHYFLGTRYFAELGYTGLYEATVLADFEDDPVGFVPGAPARDLRDNRLVDRATLLAASPRTRAAFDEERWSAFKRDLALLREAHVPEFWNHRGYTVDHGYNATPLVTAVLGVLANQSLVEPSVFLGTIRILDPYLLALVGVVVSALEGAVAGLSFLFFLFANPLNDYAYIGGAYLRYNYLIALALALIALRQRWLVASGICFAIAGWLRIFPLVFPALLLLRDVAGPGWRGRLRENAPLHAAFAITSLLVVVGSSLVVTGGSLFGNAKVPSPWPAFARTISLHANSPSANRIALEVPFSYAPEKDRHTETGGGGDEWVAETRKVLDARKLPFRIAQGVLVLVALLAMRRRPGEEVLLPGLLVVFALMPLSHYYWAVLGLIPLVIRDPRRLLMLTFLLLVLALTALPGFLSESLDLRFTIFSLEILIFLLLMLVPFARSGRSPITGRAALVAGALCVLACSPAEKPVDAPPSVHEQLPSGDIYSTTALGFSITKPASWRFLPETSLPTDGERANDREQYWEIVDRPALFPVIAFEAPGAGEDGPRVRVRAIPLRPEDSDQAIQLITSRAPQQYVGFAMAPRHRHLNLTVQEEPAPVEVSGREAGKIVLSYGLRREGDSALPVEERIYFVRRDVLSFWIEMAAPAPMDPSVAEEFDRILESFQIEP